MTGSDLAELPARSIVCPFCKGSGACGSCNGSGKRAITRRGLFHRRAKEEVKCHSCEGTKVCQLCHGTGQVNG